MLTPTDKLLCKPFMLHSNVMMPSHLAGPDKIVTWGKNEYLNENIALSLNR